MADYNNLLRNKLYWMAKQLKYFNDHISIMNWTAAMTAVKSLIDNEAVSTAALFPSAAPNASRRWADFSHRRRKRKRTYTRAARPNVFLSRRSLPVTKSDHQPEELSLTMQTKPLPEAHDPDINVMDIDEKPANAKIAYCTDPSGLSVLSNEVQTPQTTDTEHQINPTSEKQDELKVVPNTSEKTTDVVHTERPKIGPWVELPLKPEDYEKWKTALLNMLFDSGLSKSDYRGNFYKLLRDISKDTGLTGFKICPGSRKNLKRDLEEFFPGDDSVFY